MSGFLPLTSGICNGYFTMVDVKVLLIGVIGGVTFIAAVTLL
jgi:hypothetical protein